MCYSMSSSRPHISKKKEDQNDLIESKIIPESELLLYCFQMNLVWFTATITSASFPMKTPKRASASDIPWPVPYSELR